MIFVVMLRPGTLGGVGLFMFWSGVLTSLAVVRRRGAASLHRARPTTSMVPTETALTEGDRLDWEARRLVRTLRVPSPFHPRTFLNQVETLVGAPVWALDMPSAWRDFFAAVRMRVSGLVLPHANGYLILINREVAADEAVVIGHEVGHIVFGDVRRGEGHPLPAGVTPRPPNPTDLDAAGRPVLESLRQRTRICSADDLREGAHDAAAPAPAAGFGDPAESRAERVGTYIALAGTGLGEAVVDDAVTDYFDL